ncbi:hypothetical protein ACWKWC_00330 [Geodermatophilus nigrescens]
MRDARRADMPLVEDVLCPDDVPVAPDLQVMTVQILGAATEAARMVRWQVPGVGVAGEPLRPPPGHAIYLVHDSLP